MYFIDRVNLKILKMTYKVFHISIFAILFSFVASAAAQQNKSVASEPAPSCFLSEFRHIALTTHEPISRSSATQNWLAKNVMSCSIEQLNFINANRASWLGTSDSPYFAYLLDSMVEYKTANKPEMLAQIFGSLGKEGTSSVQTIGVTQLPRTQVQPLDYQQQLYQQQYQQQQAYPQAQQQPANPQATYPQPSAVGR